MVQSFAFGVSKRLQVVTTAILCLMASQLLVASCTPEPVPYATRVAIVR